MRSAHQGSLTIQLQARDGNLCHICGLVMSFTRTGDDYCASIDHVIPVSHNGTSHLRNLLLAHRWCNARRGNRSINDLTQTRQSCIQHWLSLNSWVVIKSQHILSAAEYKMFLKQR